MRISLEAVLEAAEADEGIGFCMSCGAENYYVEPDARGYDCAECDEPEVYGAMEILLMTDPTAPSYV
jgi:hypothetical protein